MFEEEHSTTAELDPHTLEELQLEMERLFLTYENLKNKVDTFSEVLDHWTRSHRKGAKLGSEESSSHRFIGFPAANDRDEHSSASGTRARCIGVGCNTLEGVTQTMVIIYLIATVITILLRLGQRKVSLSSTRHFSHDHTANSHGRHGYQQEDNELTSKRSARTRISQENHMMNEL